MFSGHDSAQFDHRAGQSLFGRRFGNIKCLGDLPGGLVLEESCHEYIPITGGKFSHGGIEFQQ